MDWVHVMRGPRQKGSKRKRRGKEKAHNNINGAGGPATPESPEKAPAAVAGDDSLESTDSPPAWVAPSPSPGLCLVDAQLTRVNFCFRKRRDGSG
jgi:hypothetical protein